MKVQVVKDAWGVSVWHTNIELVFKIVGAASKTPAEKVKKLLYPKPLREQAIWINKHMDWFKKKKVFSNRYIKRHFPDLGADLKPGGRVIMDLKFITE